MKRFYTILVSIISLLAADVMTGCNSSTQLPPPTYVHVDSFHFKVPQSGSSLYKDQSHQITQVWAYYNNNIVGVYDLPVTFPVITNGASGQLELSPGIDVDGLNNFISAYPFYTVDTGTLVSQPGKIVTVTPTTSLFTDVKNTTLFNFGAGQSQYGAESGTLTITASGDSGIITLAAGDTLEDSSQRFAIASGSAFVELDYRGTVPFYVGLDANESTYISSTPFYLTGIYPSSTWQKFYLSVADFAAQYQGTTYNLYIKAYLPPGVSSGTVYLRNIQFLSF